MKGILGAVLSLCMTGTALANSQVIGFQTTTLTDTHPDRPLQMVVWYPAATTAKAQLVGDNPVFEGAAAVTGARPATGKHPLVVISHGFGGNWINQIWLASSLAHKGYIVAAVNHPGTTSQDRTPQAAALMWQRPVDISRAIDAVLADPKKFGAVVPQQIAVIGHSFGGWTALELAGARFDPERFTEDCKTHKAMATCSVYELIKPDSTPELKARLASDLSDKRVAVVVSLDLGFSRGFTDESLAAVSVPTLIVAAGVPSPELPAELESDDLAKRLPQAVTQHVKITDASHFSFMGVCKPGAVPLIEKESPGDGFICTDAVGGRSREVIHQQVVALIAKFLAQSLPPARPIKTVL